MARKPRNMAPMKIPSRSRPGSSWFSDRPWCSVRHHSTAKWFTGTTRTASSAATAERRARVSGSAGTRRGAGHEVGGAGPRRRPQPQQAGEGGHPEGHVRGPGQARVDGDELRVVVLLDGGREAQPEPEGGHEAHQRGDPEGEGQRG